MVPSGVSTVWTEETLAGVTPENACLGDKEMSLDEVRSEGLRQWNMEMDVEYQYETFNGLPVY